MTEFLFQDAVAIDTNVFQHLLNRQNNPDGHINILLERLIGARVSLVVDNEGLIAGEYNQQLKRRLGEVSDQRTELQILRYWFSNAKRITLRLDQNDELKKVIENIIIEASENVDRAFVYVAFQRGTTLFSNDLGHIVIGHAGEPEERRVRLIRDTEGLRPQGVAILTSEEGYAKLQK